METGRHKSLMRASEEWQVVINSGSHYSACKAIVKARSDRNPYLMQITMPIEVTGMIVLGHGVILRRLRSLVAFAVLVV